MLKFTAIARIIARTSFGLRAVEEHADLSLFMKPPSIKLILGVSIIGLSMLIGWPAVALFSLVALHLRDPLVFLIGGPVTYAVSWGVWGIGMLIVGSDNVKYAKVILGWLVRNWIEKACPHTVARPMDDLKNITPPEIVAIDKESANPAALQYQIREP